MLGIPLPKTCGEWRPTLLCPTACPGAQRHYRFDWQEIPFGFLIYFSSFKKILTRVSETAILHYISSEREQHCPLPVWYESFFSSLSRWTLKQVQCHRCCGTGNQTRWKYANVWYGITFSAGQPSIHTLAYWRTMQMNVIMVRKCLMPKQYLLEYMAIIFRHDGYGT